ncbi:endolytic transglycosylase MltG [Alphaproteobacteria bacterium]|nr:endolytic transglycosylase MltG [Alphaproteobacteria bacterium]
MNLNEISNDLNKNKIIKNPFTFKLTVKILRKDRKIKAGEYLIKKSSSQYEILNLFIRGKTVLRRFTAPEGLTSKEIVYLLNNQAGLVGKINNIPFEGTLLPETYFFSYGDKRNLIIERMKKAMSVEIEKAWVKKGRNTSKLSLKEVIILASIIEKESSINKEKYRVSSVFHNRLKIGMRLQSDPTVIYSLKLDGVENNKSLSKKDLSYVSKYNTYLVYGLPPMPICNPGKISINAALNPDITEDLYFVADGKGGHRFAKKYSEHLKNVKLLRNYKKSN